MAKRDVDLMIESQRFASCEITDDDAETAGAVDHGRAVAGRVCTTGAAERGGVRAGCRWHARS